MADSVDCSNTTGYIHHVKPYLAGTAIMLYLLLVVPNLLVIILLIRSMIRSRKADSPKIIMLSLAFTDYIYGEVNVLLNVINYWLGYCASGGAAGCITRGFLSNFLLAVSLLIVTAMSCERFCALKLPFKYNTYFTPTKTCAIIAGIVIYCLVLAALPLFGVNRYGFRGFCDFFWSDPSFAGKIYTYFRAIQGLVMMAVLVLLNAVVVFEVIRMRRMVHSEVSNQNRNAPSTTSDTSQESRLITFVLLVSLTFVICNLPYLIRLLQHQSGRKLSAADDVTVKRMYLSNSIINPLLFLIYYVSGKKKIRQCVRRMCCLGGASVGVVEDNNSQPTEMTI